MKVDNLSMMLIALVCVLLGIYIYKSTDTSEAFGIGWRRRRTPKYVPFSELEEIKKAQELELVGIKKAPPLQIEKAPLDLELVGIKKAPALQIEKAPKVNTLCQDSPQWRDSRNRNCSWVARRPKRRCKKIGRTDTAMRVTAQTGCPSVCNRNCIGL